jgi:multicomponent Na+:H+ antiporter subunit G
MLQVVLDVLSWISILGGLFFIVVGTLGVLRMPDVYTRLHAAGMTDTMGAGLLILGMCFQTGLSLLTLRFLMVYAFILFTSPISTHALARAALAARVEPFRAALPGD